MNLIYIATGQPVKIGDKVPGKRLGKCYAHVMAIHADHVELLYNGDCRNYKVAFEVIDAVPLTQGYPVAEAMLLKNPMLEFQD